MGAYLFAKKIPSQGGGVKDVVTATVKLEVVDSRAVIVLEGVCRRYELSSSEGVTCLGRR